ncbi:MAG: hypothetical protein ACOC0P_06250, partial [Planctomycetota bacterium]
MTAADHSTWEGASGRSQRAHADALLGGAATAHVASRSPNADAPRAGSKTGQYTIPHPIPTPAPVPVSASDRASGPSISPGTCTTISRIDDLHGGSDSMRGRTAIRADAAMPPARLDHDVPDFSSGIGSCLPSTSSATDDARTIDVEEMGTGSKLAGTSKDAGAGAGAGPDSLAQQSEQLLAAKQLAGATSHADVDADTPAADRDADPDGEPPRGASRSDDESLRSNEAIPQADTEP